MGPTVVFSRFDHVKLVVSRLHAAASVLRAPETSFIIPCQSLRISMTVGIDGSAERVIIRDRSIVLYAQDFSGERIFFLREITLGRVACCDIQQPVGSEFHASSIVIHRPGNLIDNRCAVCQCGIFQAISLDTVFCSAVRGFGVIEIDPAILSKIRMECHTKKPSFSAMMHVFYRNNTSFVSKNEE